MRKSGVGDSQNSRQSIKNMKMHAQLHARVGFTIMTKIDVWIMIYRFDTTVTVIAHADCLHKGTTVFASVVASLAFGNCCLVSFKI